MFVHPCQKMRCAEQAAIQGGIVSSATLMQCAIDRAVSLLRRDPLFADAAHRFRSVIVYAGKGNNAGDAIGIAHALGFERILLRCAADPATMTPETRHRMEMIPEGRLTILQSEPSVAAEDGVLLIDGLLGSGAHGTLRREYAALAGEMNALRDQSPRSVALSIDIPTGLCADTGTHEPCTVRADATLAIGCVKPGMLADGAENFVGRLLCAPLPEADPGESAVQVADESLLRLLPRRPYSCYKNQAGRVRILAGSPGLTGAACMTAAAALHAGAGLVELYCPQSVHRVLAVKTPPEVMVHGVEDFSEVPVQGAQSLLIGPGLGKMSARRAQMLQELWNAAACPVVLDADALNAVAAYNLHLPRRAILTPHPGEMLRLYPAGARLTRAQIAAQFTKLHPCVLLFKGARSIITDGASVYYNSTGGPFMATGGQGDVLAGCVAALAATGLPCLQAAALGAYLCGRAAEHAWVRNGCPLSVPATQLLPRLSAILPS